MRKPLSILLLFVVTTFITNAQNLQSLKVDGNAAFAEIGNKPLFDLPNNLSIETWIKADAVQNNPFCRIVDKYHYKRMEGYNIVLDQSKIRFEFFSTGNIINTLISKTSVTDNKWHAIAATYDSSTMSLYIDGKLDTTKNIGHRLITPSSNILAFGNNDDGNGFLPFKGLIDEVRIWNVCLTAAAVKKNMKACLTGKELGLLGYWDFDSLSTTKVNDLTPHGNHGILKSNAVLIDSIPFQCAISGVDRVINREKVKIYPNPSNGKFYISIPEMSQYHSVDITDMTGRNVGRFLLKDTEEIDLSKSQPGIYFIELKDLNGLTVRVEKLIRL